MEKNDNAPGNGKPHMQRGVARPQMAGHSFSAENNYETALGWESSRVVSYNTTSIFLTLTALKKAGLLKKARGILSFVIIIVLLAWANICQGQENMLIEQIAGRDIVRTSYNEADDQISKQKFHISNLDTVKGYLSVEIRVLLFDEKEKLTDSYTTVYVCKPDESNVLVTVFPFALKNDAEYAIEASSPGFKELYDFSDNAKKLSDLSLEMSVKSGLLGFFGSRNRISIRNRNLEMKSGNYILTSDLILDAFLWGIRVKSIQYHVTEKLSAKRWLTEQKFRNEDGSYFLINYNEGTDGPKFSN